MHTSDQPASGRLSLWQRGALAAGVALLTACSPATAPGTGQQPPAASASAACIQDCRLFRFIDYDYEPAETPAVLAGQVDLVVIGSVVDIRPGRSTGADDPLPHVVVSLQVEKALRGPTTRVPKDLVFVELPVPSLKARAEVGASLPRGSRLALFVSDHTDLDDDNPVHDQDAGRPVGSRLFAPAAQGLLRELPAGTGSRSGSRLVGGFVDLETQPEAWKQLKNLDDLASAVG